jgi:membrane protease YdiL (CAAX protease family)
MTMLLGKDFLDLGKQGKSAGWRYGLGLVAVFIIWFLGSTLTLLPILFMRVFQAGSDRNAFSNEMFSLKDLNDHIPAVTMFVGVSGGFFFLILGLWFVVRFFLGRSFFTLITPYARINWKRCTQGAVVWLLLSGLGSLVEALIYPGRYQYTLRLPEMLIFLPVALLLTPIQTTAEELLVRGYLTQMTGKFTRRFFLPLILPSLVFMLLHAANLEVATGWGWMFAFYFSFGALLSFLTLKENNLELALGIHTANNLFAFLFANYIGASILSPSFFTVQTLDVVYGFISFLIQALLLYLIFFVIPGMV